MPSLFAPSSPSSSRDAVPWVEILQFLPVRDVVEGCAPACRFLQRAATAAPLWAALVACNPGVVCIAGVANQRSFRHRATYSRFVALQLFCGEFRALPALAAARLLVDARARSRNGESGRGGGDDEATAVVALQVEAWRDFARVSLGRRLEAVSPSHLSADALEPGPAAVLLLPPASYDMPPTRLCIIEGQTLRGGGDGGHTHAAGAPSRSRHADDSKDEADENGEEVDCWPAVVVAVRGSDRARSPSEQLTRRLSTDWATPLVPGTTFDVQCVLCCAVFWLIEVGEVGGAAQPAATLRIAAVRTKNPVSPPQRYSLAALACPHLHSRRRLQFSSSPSSRIAIAATLCIHSRDR
jgi:hypothetical protein